LEEHQTKSLMKTVPESMWHHALNQMPQISKQKEWNAEEIVDLTLSYCFFFHLFIYLFIINNILNL